MQLHDGRIVGKSRSGFYVSTVDPSYDCCQADGFDWNLLRFLPVPLNFGFAVLDHLLCHDPPKQPYLQYVPVQLCFLTKSSALFSCSKEFHHVKKFTQIEAKQFI